MAQIMPTIDIPLSHSVDFTLGLGYTHFFATKGSNNSGGDFTIRTGFNFISQHLQAVSHESSMCQHVTMASNLLLKVED